MTTTVLARTCRAEWSRIWTVRSSWLFALATAAAVLGVGTILGFDLMDSPPEAQADGPAWRASEITGMFGLFGVLALALVTATSDHGSGGIVPTLQWTPRRGVLLTARTAVIVTTTALVGLLLVAASCLVVWAFVPELGLEPGQGARILGWVALVYGCGALLAVGLGLFLRNTAAGLVSVIALMLVLPMILGLFPYDWASWLSSVMPGSGAMYLLVGEAFSDRVTGASAKVTLVSWAVVASLAGSWRLMETDTHR